MPKSNNFERRYGFLNTERDISFFITYVMTLLPTPITYADLLDICLIDEAFGYFEFQAQFVRLVENGIIEEDKSQAVPVFRATKKCTDNAYAVRTSLPASVKDKAQAAVARVTAKNHRNSSIHKSFTENPDGSYNAVVAVEEGGNTLFKVELMLVNRRHVEMVFNNFQKHAERYYLNIMNSLLEFSETNTEEEVTDEKK